MTGCWNPATPRQPIASTLLRVPGSLDLNQTHQWSIQLMAQGRVGGCIARHPAVFVAGDQQQQGLPPIGQRLDPVPPPWSCSAGSPQSLTKALLWLFSTSAGDVPIGWVCSGRAQRLARASAASRIRTSGTKPAPTSRGRSVDMGGRHRITIGLQQTLLSGCRDQFSDHRPIQFARCAPLTAVA